MYQFVIARDVEGGICLSEDRVAERQRQRELPVRKVRNAPLYGAAIKLNHGSANSSVPTRAKPDGANCQAN